MRRLFAIALALASLTACSRTLSTDVSGPLVQDRFACVQVDLGEQTRVVEADSTLNGDNFFTGSCGGDRAPERIYLWTVPSDGVYRISTEGSGFDTVLYLYNGNCSAEEVACSDDSGAGVNSRIDVDAEQGAQLVIVVDGYGEASGQFQLRITPI